MKKTANYYAGLTIIILGIIFLVASFMTTIRFWAVFWPVFVLMPGLILYWIWRSTGNPKKNWGIIIPSAILIIYSIVFFLNMFVYEVFHYALIWGWTSFMYIGAIAIAFWLCWTISGIKGLRFVAKILTITSVVIFLIVGLSIIFATVLPSEMVGKLWPILIILAGALVIMWQVIWNSLWRGGKFLGRTENEWREWGENLGKEIEKSVKEKTEDR